MARRGQGHGSRGTAQLQTASPAFLCQPVFWVMAPLVLAIMTLSLNGKATAIASFHRGYNLPITIWCTSARSEVFIGLWKDATCLLASE